MFLSCPNASAVQSISHEGKVVLVATVTSDGVSSLRYSVKQDGFEQTALQNPLGSGWESFKPLPLPTDSIGDASVEQWEARELSDSDGRPLLRSLYRSAQLTADAPVQLISHDGAIHVFRQSRRGTLLVDRFVLDGMTNTLNPKYEVRYKRSRQRLAPSKSMKQRPDGQLESLDGLDFRDMQNQFFTEPSIEICAPLAEGIRDGNFAVVVVPTNEPDHYRWHIFHANAGDSQVQCLSLRSGEDQVFSLYDYTKTSLDPLTNTTTYTLLHGVIQRSIALVSTRGQSLRVTNGLAAVLYDVQREQQTAAGPQLLLDATKLMLAVPTDAGVMALNFALAADGTLARISADSTETILRSKQREVLLPLSVMDEIRAVGDATPAPGGTIQAISRSTGDSNADRVRVSVADGEQAQLERLRKGDVVRLFNTTTYNGLYAVRSVENGAFCIDAPFRYDDVGEWEKLEEEDNGLVFDGLITAYEKTGDGVVKVEAVNHGLLAGDLVQIVESPDVGGEYQILERDAQGFTVQRLWGSAEAVNVKIAMRKRRGLVFDGKSDGIRAELATTVHLAKGFTLETWVKLSRSGNQTLVATVPESPAPGVAQRCWQALLGIKAGKLNVTYRPINLGATEAVSLSAKQKAPLQEWLHVACSFDGEQLRLMQNGKEVASLAGSALEQAAAAGHAALLEALTADANQAAADLSTSGLPADHPCNYLAGRWVCRSSEQLLTPEDGGTAALGWPSEQLQQSWTVERQAPDRFSLRHSGSGQVLNHGGRLVRWQNKPDQLWSLRAAGGGWYQLCSPESNQVLAADGSQVRLVVAESSAGDTSEQLWRFDPIGATKVNIAQTALAAARLLAPRPGQGIPVAVAALTMAGHEEAGSWKAPFQGQLSDLRFWDSGRPAQQVSHAMHLQMLGRERGLLGSWRLGGVASDDDGVQRVFDFSVNANHGVVRGAPYDGGILLGRTLRDQTTAAVMFSNGDLVAVSEGAIYVESFEFRTDPSLDPRNADGKQGAIFAPSLWGRSSRGAEEKQAITATQEGFQFEELGEGWWRASSRFVIPQGVRLLRCFELAQVRGSWSTLELRRHGLNLVSDTVTLSLADEQAQLSLASGEAALALGQEDMAAQLAKAEQTAKAALEMAALSKSQLEKEKADPRHFTRINLVQDSDQKLPVVAGSYKAVSFNPKTKDCITLPPEALPTGPEITISFWLSSSGEAPLQNSVIVAFDKSNNRTLWISLPWSDGYVHFDCGNANTDRWDRLSKEINLDSVKGIWTHWAFTKNTVTGVMRIIRNGEVWAESKGNMRSMAQAVNLCVGAAKAEKPFLSGEVDQLQIWSRERSPLEIQASMRQSPRNDEAGLCGYWQGFAGRFIDLSPAQRHGTLCGAPSWVTSVLGSAQPGLATEALPDFMTSPEGQWEALLQTDQSGALSGRFRLCGAKVNAVFLGRLAAVGGERPSLLDHSDPERNRWILEPSHTSGSYRLRAPGEPLAYLGWSNNYTFKTPASFLRFDGRQDYVEVPFKTGVHDLKVFTVAFWVRFEKGLFGSPLTCRSQPSGAGLSGYMFYVDQNHQVQFSVGRSSDWLTVFSSKLSPNTWVHVCGSYDGQAIRLYVNGELSGSQNCTDYRPNVAAANRPLRLGAGSTESTPNHFLKGDVAEVSLWNQPLNSPQIKAFMNRSLSGREPALVAYYPLSALDTIAGKERCLVDRAGLNPGQVVGGRPQLITADERSSGYRLDPGFQSLGLGSTPMAFQLKPVAGTETPAGAQQIQAAAVNYAAAEAEATQAAEQLAELRAMFDLLAELGFTSPAGKTTSFPPLADLLPPLAAAESREAELVSRMKWLKIAIGQLSDIDKLRLDLSAQVIVTDQHLRDLERAKNWLREERNDTSNYWGVLLIGVDSGRYMVTHQDSLRPTWGKKACLGIDDEGATIEVDHSNFARGWWQVQKLVSNTWTTVNSRDRSGGFALFNPSPASNGGQLLCSVPWPREIILAGAGEVRSAINRLFTVNTFGRDGGELVEIQALNGGYIGASNHEWNGSLVWTDVRGCLFRMIGSPGTEHAEGASRIQHRRSLVKARTQKYNDARSCLEELTIRLDSQSKLLLAYQRELTDVTEQLAGQLKRIQMLRSIYLTRLSASQSEAQVLPALPEQEDPRGLIVQGGVIPFPRAASRLTASAGCNGIVSFLYHDPRANLVRARYDTAYDADGRGEEWIPDGFHAALALEGTRSILGLPAALFRPLNQQITLEFWARCDSSHPNEVVFLVGLDRQNRPLLRIQLPNAKEEVVWEAGANPSDGSLDRLSCSVPASLYREAWTHWAFVKDAERGEMHIYANGQILASHIPEAGGAKPLQQPLGGICRAALGGAPGASQAWQGQISELRLWNRALSPRTIESNSVLTLAGNEPGLLAYYPLNEASGEFARDHSGQGFSMRITGASWVPCTAPMGRLPEQQPTALIRDMTPLAGKQPLALPPVGLQGGGFSLGMRLRVEAFLPTTTLVELSTEDQSDVLSMGYLPAKQLWTLQQRVKGVVHSLEFKLELKTNDWVHLAFTISAKGEVLAYRNGVAVGSGLLPLPGPGLRTANVAGGANAGAASAYPARIEHLRVWDKALSRWEIARQALHAPGFGHAVLAEYSRVVIDAQKRKNAMMMRCLAIANSDGIALLDEQWIENLEMKWVGNTQINPTLIGYIEGAPPIPSENLTEEDDYNGATSVELVQSSDVAYSWTREQDVSLGAEIEVLLGAQSETTAGTPFVQTTLEEVKTGLGAKFDFAYHWQNSSTVEASSSLSQSDRLELRGCQEEAPRFPHLGRRFIPKNVGYALVTSGLADVFVSRLSRSGRMVGYQVLPVEGMPPDVNTITFLMNPAYTMAGSLDGLTGSAPTSQRFHRHVPGMRAQYGSLYPASYYRLQEAYNLKAEIDKRDQQRQAYFNQFNAGMVDETSLTRNINAGPEPDPVGSPGGSIAVGADDTSPEMKELDAKIAAKKAQIELAENSGKSEDTQRVPLLKAEEIALQKQRSDLSTKEQESRKKEGAARQHEIDAKHKDLSARAHATDSFASWQRTMENLQIRAAKRNIVNTYVWDGDGGFHAEEQQFASTVEHSIGGSFDMGFAMGGKASLAVGKVLVELSAYAKLSLTQTMNKTQTTSTGMELHVDLGGVESRRITDHRDYPLFPGEKVDRYRFMSFYLENNASHWHDFFNTVVDPEWLSSNDEEARALRQTRQALPNKVWRVLHRVTYVERPTLMGFGRQQAPVNELSDAMQELQVQVQELTTKVDKVQRTLDAQE